MDRRNFVSLTSGAALAATALRNAPSTAAAPGQEGAAPAVGGAPRARHTAASGAPTELQERPLEASLAIVDAHHHLWDFPSRPGYPLGRFLLPDLLREIAQSGQPVTQTVFAECFAMYRADGPEELKPIGETEFVNGAAAMAASGRYGSCRVAAGIIGTADLRLGERVRPVLEAQIAAGNGRFRGVRIATAWAATPLFGQPSDPAAKERLLDPNVLHAAAILGKLGLRWDIWVCHPQLAQVASAADAVPGTPIILDHLGTPLLGAAPQAEVFADWKRAMVELARRPHVVVKLGGLGMDFAVPIGARLGNASSTVLAARWRPWIETTIAAFGPERCMFESNFPPDAATCHYGALWNAFRRITAGYSAAEKAALYSGTARRVYGLEAQS